MGAEVLADSANAVTGDRITTLRVSFPRVVLAEFNTHRMLSRNSASSRSIPVERQIERVEMSPYVPAVFGSYARGMGQGKADPGQEGMLRHQWLKAANEAAIRARIMNEHGGAKQQINRILEPYIDDHTVIVTATDLDNFFKLRLPSEPVAVDRFGRDVYEVLYDTEQFGPQPAPEMQKLAIEMFEAMRDSEPRDLRPGEWHLPLVTDDERFEFEERTCADISAGRCAKVSYERDHEKEPPEASMGRTDALAGAGHWSPLEHPAMAMEESVYEGNFRGWCQLRKMHFDESGQRPKTYPRPVRA